jgi:hypothetical protein
MRNGPQSGEGTRPAPRVCIATVIGGYAHARVLDRVLAQAIEARGAKAEFLLCDRAIPACQFIKPERATAEQLAARESVPHCARCIEQGKVGLGDLGIPLRFMGDYLEPSDIEWAMQMAMDVPLDEIRSFRWEGFAVGEHAYAGALRYFARGDLFGEPLGGEVLRCYLDAGLRTIISLRRMLLRHQYDILVLNHGIYIPQGMICEVARAFGVRVVTYNPAYRKHSFIFSHEQSYHFTMLDEPTEHWRGLDMTPDLTADLSAYLMSRRYGTNDWIWFHDQPKEDVAPFLREIGCDPNRPFVALLTSVVWDAQLHYKTNAFPNMLDWLRRTVEYWGRRTDELQLVIRVHPAEVRGLVPSRQRVADELAAYFPTFPKNVFIIGPENQASTYALCDHANAVIIYNTKTGVETSALGIPVIVAGEAWIRSKDFAMDAVDARDYFEILDSLPLSERMSAEKTALANKYAYHFFFRRMIPLPFIHQVKPGKFQVKLEGDHHFGPGEFPGLDTICDGILTGAPFIYRAEHLANPFPGER